MGVVILACVAICVTAVICLMESYKQSNPTTTIGSLFIASASFALMIYGVIKLLGA